MGYYAKRFMRVGVSHHTIVHACRLSSVHAGYMCNSNTATTSELRVNRDMVLLNAVYPAVAPAGA